ncbi:MAG: DUF4843 domain-containing protein [Prevotellaceae bacterium]|nr:DUF4843 domain-containing protein [Prevotellaceae bacterium]
MKKLKIFAMAAVAGLSVMSCSETDYMTFDTANNGVYFTKDTLTYSFSVTPIEVKTYTYNVPFRIMGPTSSQQRTVKYSIDESLTTAKAGVQYNIGEAIVMPDSINGYIPVEILRDGLEGTYATGYTRYTLVLRLQENENFKPTLDSESQCRTLTFDNAIEQPEWYNAHGDKVWSVTTLGVWHPYKFIKMVEYFHAIADILPETYKKMVEAYGENLEHIPYGDPYVYGTIFKKYIYQPMYDFFNDPANHDMIVAAYPDFPFDFPKP